MIDPDLKLVVFGPLGSGKTTLAQLLVRRLREDGVNVILRDPFEEDITDETYEMLLKRMRERSLDHPVASVRTQQTPRNCTGARIRVLDWRDEESDEHDINVELSVAGNGVLLTAEAARSHAYRLLDAANELDLLKKALL